MLKKYLLAALAFLLAGCTTIVVPQEKMKLAGTATTSIPTPIVQPGGSISIAGTDLTKPVSGTITVTATMLYPPIPLNVVTAAGATQPGNIGSTLTLLDGAILNGGIVNGPVQTQVIDTTKLTNGQHFLWFEGQQWINQTPALWGQWVVQGYAPFTVANPTSPTYTGTIQPAFTDPPGTMIPGHIMRDLFSGSVQLTPAQITAAGFNTAELQMVVNPNDGPGNWRNTTLAAAEAVSDNWVLGNAAKLPPNFHVLILNDQLMRISGYQEFIADCPWAPQFITHCAATLAPYAIGAEQCDEMPLGNSPDAPAAWTPFVQGANSYPFTFTSKTFPGIRAAMLAGAPNIKISWPCATLDAYQKHAAWQYIGDCSDIYWGTNWAAYGSVDSLANQVQAFNTKLATFLPIPAKRPLIGLISVNSGSPSAVTGQIANQLAHGVTALRFYNADALAGFPANWQAMTLFNAWMGQHEADLLQSLAPSPYLGPSIVTGAKSGPSSNVLIVLNTLDMPQPVSVPLGALKANGGKVTAYLVHGTDAIATIPIGTNVTVSSFTMPANGVQIFICPTPGQAGNVVVTP